MTLSTAILKGAFLVVTTHLPAQHRGMSYTHQLGFDAGADMCHSRSHSSEINGFLKVLWFPPPHKATDINNHGFKNAFIT